MTNSICAPSRAVMLTGKCSHLNGLRDNRDTFDGDMDHWELYDLETDPHELVNVYDQEEYLAIQETLHTRLAELRRELKDQ